MADDGFAVPRLIALYDRAEGDRADLVHYERIVAELKATSVLDIGCGTGTFACRLAASGLTVVGIDPAEASLDIARRKAGGRHVSWILGDANDTPSGLEADVALMTGNVAQVFLTDDEWDDTLRSIGRALRPGGHLVFETRDPAFRGWEEWTKERSLTVLREPGGGDVETWVELVDVSQPFVSFRWTYRFASDGAELTSNSTLRFRGRDEIASSLEAADFDVIEVRDAPDRPGKEFVFIAQSRLRR